MRCSKLVIAQKPNDNKMLVLPIGNRVFVPHGTTTTSRPSSSRVCVVRASMVDSYESSFDFVKRMEKAWLISQVVNQLLQFHLFYLFIYDLFIELLDLSCVWLHRIGFL